MNTLAQLVVLTTVTLFAGSLAWVMAWMFLRGAFRLMQPAAANRVRTAQSELVHGTQIAARHFAHR
jgi:hypothetical protein